ncbi:MAG TPA: alanine racemase [Longimicrobiales bacterium]|nr:alanine racemase [Longimicrobiales bacterium]
MSVSRRSFVTALAAASVAPVRLAAGATPPPAPLQMSGRFDPWVEVDASAVLDNAATLARLAGGRPLLAVVKNNGYGAGYAEAARILGGSPHVEGFAVVKTAEAHTLRDAGVTKPVLLMAVYADADGPDLVRRDVMLAPCTDDGVERAIRAARAAGWQAGIHFYVDTGLGRMGVPAHRALPLMVAARSAPELRVEGTFMTFTEEADFDAEQLRRFRELTTSATARGLQVGRLHAASSHSVFNRPDGYLDLVRPGISLFGGYPTDDGRERSIAELRCALRLRARVVRVEHMRPGDSVGYGRRWVAERPTWTATIPVGHTDGYPRQAVNGARVLIGARLYPVIGAVSASHCIVEVGDEATVAVGDVATLLGPDHPAIEPNALAMATGTSVYDRLMHLNPSIPRVVL